MKNDSKFHKKKSINQSIKILNISCSFNASILFLFYYNRLLLIISFHRYFYIYIEIKKTLKTFLQKVLSTEKVEEAIRIFPLLGKN